VERVSKKYRGEGKNLRLKEKEMFGLQSSATFGQGKKETREFLRGEVKERILW